MPAPGISTPPPPLANPASAPLASAAPSMSLTRFLGSAAFLGAEGGLLAIATVSLLGTVFGGAVWLAMLGLLVFLQLRRTIEGKDLLIIAGLTLAAVIFFGALNKALGGNIQLVILTTIMAAGAVVAIAIIFRLIFRLVSRIM